MVVSNNKEISYEFLPLLRVFKDGSVERYLDSPYVPPSLEDLSTGVSSKDINISPGISARIYLPKLSTTNQKLPILAYFHGGGFCIESAFSFLSHRYINTLVFHAKILVVSVEYRLAPENPLPTAYEDSWAALQWIAKHLIHDQNFKKEPWLLNHADFSRVFVGGDSAGANIAHNISLRASHEGLNYGMKIYGVLLSHPYFLGSKPIGSEPGFDDFDKNLLYKTWEFVYPNVPGGFDNPLINPFSNDAPCLSVLQFSRLLVCVAEKDELRDRGIRYFHAMKKSDQCKRRVELFEVEGEDHCFQIFNLESDGAKIMFKRLAAFFNASVN